MQGEEGIQAKVFPFPPFNKDRSEFGHMQSELKRFVEKEAWKMKPVLIKFRKWVKR